MGEARHVIDRYARPLTDRLRSHPHDRGEAAGAAGPGKGALQAGVEYALLHGARM
jgi:hypothetical protein